MVGGVSALTSARRAPTFEGSQPARAASSCMRVCLNARSCGLVGTMVGLTWAMVDPEVSGEAPS